MSNVNLIIMAWIVVRLSYGTVPIKQRDGRSHGRYTDSLTAKSHTGSTCFNSVYTNKLNYNICGTEYAHDTAKIGLLTLLLDTMAGSLYFIFSSILQFLSRQTNSNFMFFTVRFK